MTELVVDVDAADSELPPPAQEALARDGESTPTTTGSRGPSLNTAARPNAPSAPNTNEVVSALAPESIDPPAAPGDAPAAPLAEGVPAPVPRRKIDLGLDGTMFLPPPPAATRPPGRGEAEGKRAVDIERRLAASLAAADVERGLARGGALIGTLNSAIRAEGPTRGEAMFQVTIDSNGNVGAVELLRGDPKEWSAASRAFLQQAKLKRLRVPKGARGLRVTYAVQTKVQYPSGRTEAPPVGIKSPSLEPDGLLLRGSFDPADIGSVARRMVYARVVSEEVL